MQALQSSIKSAVHLHFICISSVPVGCRLHFPKAEKRDHVPGNGSGETKRVFILPPSLCNFLFYSLFSILDFLFLFDLFLPSSPFFFSYIFSISLFDFRAFGNPVSFVHRGLCGHYDLLSLYYSSSPYPGVPSNPTISIVRPSKTFILIKNAISRRHG